MENERNILQLIEYVRNMSQGNGLDLDLVKSPPGNIDNLKENTFNDTIQILCNYFNLNEMQVTILCAAICFYFEENGEPCEYRNLAKFFDVSIMQLLLHNSDFEELRSRQLIVPPEENSRIQRYHYVRNKSDITFTINPKVIQCVLKNVPLVLESEHPMDYVEFVNEVASKVDNRSRVNMKTQELMNEVIELEDKLLKDGDKKYDFNNDDDIEKMLSSYFISVTKEHLECISHRIFFYDICHDFLCGYDSSLEKTLNDIFTNRTSLFEASEMMEGNHPLIKQNLVEFVKKGTLTQATLTLGPVGRELLLGKDSALFEAAINDENYVKPEKILKRDLFFEETFSNKLHELTDYLMPVRLAEIQNQLKNKNMSQGFTVMLYGPSGTGKTETALQLAKKTGRAIYHVDISSTKSAWFGDSEKALKKIFSRYKCFCDQARKTSRPIPILLFNEADAVFTKRTACDMPGSNNATTKTENAMQNILLEELENFDGILIATTNRPDYMDSAFMRRFLYKLEFTLPVKEAAFYIWKTKLEWLNDDDIEDVLCEYTLSGGMIDNVARKAIMYEVLHGEQPELSMIRSWCEEE